MRAAVSRGWVVATSRVGDCERESFDGRESEAFAGDPIGELGKLNWALRPGRAGHVASDLRQQIHVT